jgi:hypothetical protein
MNAGGSAFLIPPLAVPALGMENIAMKPEGTMQPGSALSAKSRAQWIAFAPFVFQATVVMRDSGLLTALGDAGNRGAEVSELAAATGISPYGIRVLLDFGCSIGLVTGNDRRYQLDKTGYFVLHDEMTRVNMDFTRDVCYAGLARLGDSIRDGKPRGLAALGGWTTLYEGLTELPGSAGESWLRFDHYYSDRAFDAFLPIVFREPVREILDIGGNTGRWALRCLAHDPQVRVTIMDLPRQLELARCNIEQAGYASRFNVYPIDVLTDEREFYRGADVIWMSQFLDCFSESEILGILQRTAVVMDADTVLYIVELFPDRQRYAAASFSLDATSLYFSCIANGNSRMYHSQDLISLIRQAGLVIEQEMDDIGEGHTILCCARTPQSR